MTNYPYLEILDYWNIKFKKTRPDIDINGSPQRTEFRIVIEDIYDKLYILENISQKKYNSKIIIAKTLNYLHSKNLNTIYYLKNKNNKFIQSINGKLWQIMQFIEGTKLNRPKYVFEEFRAKPITKFLKKFKQITECDEFKKHFNTFILKSNFTSKNYEFSLKNYVYDIVEDIKQNNPEYMNRIKPIIEFLKKDYFKIYDQLKTKFCHGDFHAMNIIWSQKDINAVIDWEFTGYKVENYDIANMIGCLGIEDPNALTADLVINIIKEIKTNFIEDKAWKYLVDTIVALRFGWLSEWLRFKDKQMINLEIDYINILIDNKERLLSKWNIT